VASSVAPFHGTIGANSGHDDVNRSRTVSDPENDNLIGAHEEHAEQFTSTLANVGQELDYLDRPDGHRRWSTPTRR
jgi:hypothetical protein